MRRWNPPIIAAMLSAIFVSALAGSAGASTAAQGLQHDPLGAATVLVTPPGADGARKLVCHNLGSSGQDGVSIACPATTGMTFRLGRPAVNTALNTGRFTQIRGLVGGTTSLIGTLHEARTGSSVTLTCDVPGVTECRIDLWNGSVLVYSALRPITTGVSWSSPTASIAIDEPGVQIACAEENRGTSSRFMMELDRPAALDMNVGTFTAPATRIRITCQMPQGVGRITECRITESSDGTGVCALELEREGVVDEKPNLTGTPTPHGLVLWSGSGCSLASASPAGGYVITPDGTGDPQRISLWGLPPGEPYLSPMSLIQCNLLPSDMTVTTPCALTLSMQCATDDGSGTPGTATESLDMTMGSPNKLVWSPHSNLSSEEFVCEGYYQGALVITITGNNFSSFSTTQSPRVAATMISDGRCCASCRFAVGTLGFVNGVGHDLDSLVWTYRAQAGQAEVPKLGVTQCDLAVSSVSTLHVNGGAGASSAAYARAGGRGVSGGKGALVVPIPGGVERKIRVSNIGSSGEDGVEFSMKKGLNAVNVKLCEPDLSDPTSVRPTRIMCRAMPCDDGTCQPLGQLDITGMDTPNARHQMIVTVPAGSCGPAFISAGGRIVPVRDADSDGDTFPDVSPFGGSTVSVSNVACRVDSPTSLTWTVAFASPVSLTISGQSFSTSSVLFYQNRGGCGGGGGGGAGGMKVLSLWGLPPGEPFLTSQGVCDLTIGEPGVSSDGLAIGDPGVNGNLAGWPVSPTWSFVTGDMDCDRGSDGFLELTTLPNQVISLGEPTLTADFPSGLATGVVTKGHYADLGGTPTAKNASIDITGNPGGSVSSKVMGLDLSIPPPGSPVSLTCTRDGGLPSLRCDVWSFGIPVMSFPYTGPLSVDGVPDVIAFVANVDGDGQTHTHCSGFPAGNKIYVFGGSAACDSIVITSLGAPPVTSLSRYGAKKGISGATKRTERVAMIPRVVSTTGVTPTPNTPVAFALSRPEPNPLRTSTTLRFSLPAASLVRAEVLDVTGRVVATLLNGRLAAGEHQLRWDGQAADGTTAAPGLYFVRVQRAGGEALAARVTRLR